MKSKRIVSVICLVLAAVMMFGLVLSALGGAMAVTQAEIDELKQQQEQINQQKDSLKGTISDLAGQINEVVALKTALDEQNELTRQEIELINEKISLYEGLVEQKAVELEQAIEDEETQKQELRVRMRKMEESGTVSYISIIFNATSFMDLLSRLDSIDMVLKRDKEVEEAYLAAREHVEVVKAEYEQTLADSEATKVELEDKKAQLEQDIADAQAVITELDNHKAELEKQLDAYDAQGAELGDIIAQKEKELEEQKKTLTYGTGSYIWPLAGGPKVNYPSYSYGPRLHPILGYVRNHNGEDIHAGYGEPILAADSGTVTVANYGYGGGYGNYVVLSHGNGRSTTYAHMSSIAVTYGQSVTQGDVIGYVGSTGLSTGPHLHWETRENGQLVDPKSYFNL